MKGYGPLESKACKWGPNTNSYIHIIQLLQSAAENTNTHILTHSNTALYGRLHVDDIYIQSALPKLNSHKPNNRPSRRPPPQPPSHLPLSLTPHKPNCPPPPTQSQWIRLRQS